MNRLFLLAAICMGSISANACVTYSPGNGTYTVDTSGCVEHGNGSSKPGHNKPGW